MNRPLLIPLAAAAMFLPACQKPRETVAAPKPNPTPVPTPHPAQAARARAVRLYPDLARKDSTFNRAFLEIYEQRQKTHPSSIAQVDWPLDVAQRAGTMLGVSPQSDVAPEPEPPPLPATPQPLRAANPLERGTYNERQNVSRPPVILDNRGNRVPMR